MMSLSELFARTFESVYHWRNRKATCARQLENDLFDGNVYTIDSFYEQHSCYFDRPTEFFRDFRYPDAPNLRQGIHPAEKLPQHPDAQCLLFDSPIQTEWMENNLVPL